jgi:hypothetical protein
MRSEVSWVGLGENHFSRIVQVMMKRKYADTARVRAPDGRGGDGGVDVIAVDPDGAQHVYQIKFFSDGFSGDRKTTRKKQIKKSFDRACKLEPRPSTWTLVVPKQLTPGERKFVTDLRAEEGRSPTIIIADSDDLDELIATMPDIHQYLARDAVAELLDEYHIERGPLIEDEADLTARFTGLAQRADSLNPHWGLDMHRRGDTISYALRPKHPNAAEDDPVTLRVSATFGPDDAGEHDAFLRSIKFGARGSVRLPGHVVTHAAVESSHPVFNTEIENPEVVLTTHSLTEPRNVEFRFKDSTGATVASQDGVLEHANHGADGISSAFRVLDRVELDADFAFRRDGNGGPALEAAGPMRMKYTLADIYPDDAVRVIDFLHRLADESLRCEVLIEGQSAFVFSAVFHLDQDEDLAIVGSAAYDLAVLQEHLHRRFKLPVELPTLLRINMRVARAVLRGWVVESPLADTLTIELHADSDPNEVRTWLNGDAPFQVPMEDFSFEVAGHELRLDGVRAFTRRGRVVNADEVAAALDAGNLAGCSVRIRADDQRYFLVYMPDRAPTDESKVEQAWWTLPGITQPGTPPDEEFKSFTELT